MIKSIFKIGLLCTAFSAHSQNITMEFPAFAGKNYTFMLFQGNDSPVVQQATIPADGKFTLTVPKEYKPYTGIGRWMLSGEENQGIGLNITIPGQDISITCLSEHPDPSNISFSNGDAQKEIMMAFEEQQKIVGRFEALSKALPFYSEEEAFGQTLRTEVALLDQTFQAFRYKIKQQQDYTSQLFPILSLTQGITTKLTTDDRQRAELANDYMVNDLDFGVLYVSGQWESIPQIFGTIHSNVFQDQAKFVDDFKKLSNRLPNAKLYTDFLVKLTGTLSQYGKDAYIEAITPAVVSSGKVKDYAGNLKAYLKPVAGIKAPALQVNTPANTKTITLDLAKQKSRYQLLLFVQSGCGHCEETLNGLKEQYAALQAKGVNIIALYADTDATAFEQGTAAMPWSQNYCDLKGLEGINFKNYGVIGTPTMFLIDQKGKILSTPATFALLQETLSKL